jgi:hypothetical protein
MPSKTKVSKLWLSLMDSHPLIPHLIHKDCSEAMIINTEFKVTCTIAIDSLELAAEELLLTYSERILFEETISVLKSSRAHYSSIVRRLADATKR